MSLLKKRWIRRLLCFVLFAVAAIYTQRFCHRQTDGFSLLKIQSRLSYHPEWEVAPLSTREDWKIKEILSQKFRYLTKGAQCHVFVSEDNRFVLKFFRHHHMRPPIWLTALPSVFEPYRSKKIEKKWSKLYKDFASYKLAYMELKEKTGILFLHLNKTDHIRQSVTIVDKIGIEHVLDMDQMEFILQKKAMLIYPQIDRWIEQGKKERAKEGLSDLVSLLKLRFSKGLFDKDPDLNTNFGFIESQAIQIDVGRFSKKKPSPRHDAILRITDNLKQYLDSRYPELSVHLQEEIAK